MKATAGRVQANREVRRRVGVGVQRCPQPYKYLPLSTERPNPLLPGLERPRSLSGFSPHLAADSPRPTSGHDFRPNTFCFHIKNAHVFSAVHQYAFLGDFRSSLTFSEAGTPLTCASRGGLVSTLCRRRENWQVEW
jgi:hypothetical protein